MKIKVLNPKHVVYDGEVKSLLVPGDRSEFEILDHHAPIVSLLGEGELVLDWKKRIPVSGGMIKFDNNECMILIEE